MNLGFFPTSRKYIGVQIRPFEKDEWVNITVKTGPTKKASVPKITSHQEDKKPNEQNNTSSITTKNPKIDILMRSQNVDGSWDDFDPIDSDLMSRSGKKVAATFGSIVYLTNNTGNRLKGLKLIIAKGIKYLKSNVNIDWESEVNKSCGINQGDSTVIYNDNIPPMYDHPIGPITFSQYLMTLWERDPNSGRCVTRKKSCTGGIYLIEVAFYLLSRIDKMFPRLNYFELLNFIKQNLPNPNEKVHVCIACNSIYLGYARRAFKAAENEPGPFGLTLGNSFQPLTESELAVKKSLPLGVCAAAVKPYTFSINLADSPLLYSHPFLRKPSGLNQPLVRARPPIIAPLHKSQSQYIPPVRSFQALRPLPNQQAPLKESHS